MITNDKIIEIYCDIDDFMKEYHQILTFYSLEDFSKKKRKRKFTISDSEVMSILILFHLKSYRNLKHFYLDYVSKHMRDLFPNLVSYNRFVELQKKVAQPLGVFKKTSHHRVGK